MNSNRQLRGLSTAVAIIALFQIVPAQLLNKYYPSGRAPLLSTAYVKLPFGAVKPRQWLDSQLVLQANGLTGHLDEIWSAVATPSGLPKSGNEYLYNYYEGLVPLAYLLNNAALIKKAKTDVDYFLTNSNYLSANTENFDHACINRMMVEYYEITQDSRVIPAMTDYFHTINTAGLTGDDYSMVRLGEHLSYAYWLYNRTGDTVILNAVAKQCKNSIDVWKNYFRDFPSAGQPLADGDNDSVNGCSNNGNYGAMYTHNVNNAEAFKYGLYYLQSKDTAYRSASFHGLAGIDKWDGQACGRFNSDEHFHGKKPTQGLECCGVCEMAYSMEKLFEAFGNPALADRTEYLLYNSFPGTCTGDMWAHQYNQQANQVLVNFADRPWYVDWKASNEYGLYPNVACCLCNFNQPWPRFVEHMWMATQNNGLIAVLYGPCQMSALAGSDSANVVITETTEYPFDGTIGFSVTVSKPDSFPIYFRIPQWENNATIQVGTSTPSSPVGGTLYEVNRIWHTGDSVTLTFPMAIRTESRWNNSLCVMRGPLWYTLKIGETWKQLATYGQGSRDWEIDPTTAWNVALKVDPSHPAGSFTVVRNPISRVPFAQKGEQVYLPGATSFTTWTQDPPVVLKAQGRILTGWTMNGANAGDDPVSPLTSTVAGKDTSIELIPYGAAKLRVTEFPWLNTPVGAINAALHPKKSVVMAVIEQSGKCRIAVSQAGAFDLTLLDVAGRGAYRVNAQGPKSFVLQKGMVHKGTYVARLISGGRGITEKVVIAQEG